MAESNPTTAVLNLEGRAATATVPATDTPALSTSPAALSSDKPQSRLQKYLPSSNIWQNIAVLIASAVALMTIYYVVRTYSLALWTAKKDYYTFCDVLENDIAVTTCLAEYPSYLDKVKRLIKACNGIRHNIGNSSGKYYSDSGDEISMNLLERLPLIAQDLAKSAPGSKFLQNSLALGPYVVPAILLYTLLCSALRFRRRNAMHKKFNYPDRGSFSFMTNTDAHQIMKYIAQWEFPKMYSTSLQFALFKTYGIPTISKLLVATRMLSTPENSSKRYEDTTVLIGEFITNDPRSERAIQAISRMNYLHSPFIKTGQISNADLLYTLSVFVTEPISWIERYEWRSLTDMEIAAIGTFWKSIGDAMEITYKGYLPRESWKDGIEFYEDIKGWAHQYEIKHMVPAQTNKKTADELVPLLLFYTPMFMRQFFTQVVGVMMGERLRDSMLYPAPSTTASLVTYTLLSARRFFLRFFCLPRLTPWVEFTDKDPKTGKYNHQHYLVHPYYTKPTFWNRWGPIALFTWAVGGVVPGGKDGMKYSPDGYKFEEVGPDANKGKGIEELKAWEEKITKERPAGCPFAFTG